jgi:hypothetical protein
MKKIVAKLFIGLMVLGSIPVFGMENNHTGVNSFTTNSTSKVVNFSAVAQNRYLIKFRNNSRWDIRRIYLSTTETNKWGQDQLGAETLRSGGTFTLNDIRPGEYDLMLIDEDNDKCVMRNIKLFESKELTISSDWLVACQKSSS